MNSRGIQQFIQIARRLPPKYWVVIGIVAAGYFFAEPILERSLGKPLPGFNNNQTVQAELDQRELDKANNTVPTIDPDGALGSLGKGPTSTSTGSKGSDKNRQDLNDLFDANRNVNSPKTGSNSGTQSKSKSPLPKIATQAPASTKSSTQNTPKLGELTEVGRKVFESTAGLIYTPGSHEGHRLAHIERHTEDQPNRQGSHGVFDGGRSGMLAVLDEAYLLALKGGRGVETEKQDGRTVYTVDMRRRVGFIGGQTGKRKRNPPVNRVRLVLEGEKVITAYPYR